MQTERVTFLTTPENKAALDAYAASNGQSVGHILREASSRYIADSDESGDAEVLALVLPVLEEMLPKWNAKLEAMERSIDRARSAIDRALEGDPA